MSKWREIKDPTFEDIEIGDILTLGNGGRGGVTITGIVRALKLLRMKYESGRVGNHVFSILFDGDSNFRGCGDGFTKIVRLERPDGEE